MVFLFGLELAGFQFVEKGVQAPEVALPKLAVALQPFGGSREGLGFEAAWAALCVAAAGNQAGALEDLEVLGDGGLAHGEGLGELGDGGLAGGEACEDGATGGIGEGGEGGVEAVGGHLCITYRLHNRVAIYDEARRLSSKFWPTRFGGDRVALLATAWRMAMKNVCLVSDDDSLWVC